MINKSVYLAGPITGEDYDSATGWRSDVKQSLERAGITCISPMRNKDYLAAETKIADSYESSILSSKAGINIRDFNDVKRAGCLLVNLLDTKRVSIGTVMEVAWARIWNIPVVLIIDNDGNMHDHAMLTYNVLRTDDIVVGIQTVKRILCTE